MERINALCVVCACLCECVRPRLNVYVFADEVLRAEKKVEQEEEEEEEGCP